VVATAKLMVMNVKPEDLVYVTALEPASKRINKETTIKETTIKMSNFV
jgi:hypothetical protein